MSGLNFNLEDLSVADSQRLLEQGFAPSDLISLYHLETPIVINDGTQPKFD